jgi:hypothetical protein
VYRWGLLFEYSITSYWVGEFANSVRACDSLLRMPDLPAGHRGQTARNRNLGIRKQAQQLAARAVTSTTQTRRPKWSNEARRQ